MEISEVAEEYGLEKHDMLAALGHQPLLQKIFNLKSGSC